MATPSVEVSLPEGGAVPLDEEEVVELVLSVLGAEGVGEAEISIALVGDDEIAALNQEYLNHEGPTDVISFPLPAPGGVRVGDVYVGAAQAERQAAELGVPYREELLRLVVHGTLHVLGHEHPEDEGRSESPMYRRQEELLGAFLARHPTRP